MSDRLFSTDILTIFVSKSPPPASPEGEADGGQP
jgi:hypothetical protein